MGAGLNAYNGGGMQPGPMAPNANVNMMGGQQNENNNYHFRFKIAIVGDSGNGKTTFLDAISQTLGSVVENEESSELHIKIRNFNNCKNLNLFTKIDYFLHRRRLPVQDRLLRYAWERATSQICA